MIKLVKWILVGSPLVVFSTGNCKFHWYLYFWNWTDSSEFPYVWELIYFDEIVFVKVIGETKNSGTGFMKVAVI